MGKIAFVFAGQGAQTVGMGKDLYENIESAKNAFDLLDESQKDICFNGPSDDLNRTINTQPCLFAMDLACAYALNEKGIYADGVAGFSLGEIPALAYSKILSKKVAFELVCIRANLMEEATKKHKGCMFAVVKLSAEKVEEICKKIEKTYPVNYNCYSQTVVATALSSVEQLQKSVVENGGKALKLAVSGAFHSPFMYDVTSSLYEYLKDIEFDTMQVPLYSNLTANIYDEPKELIAKQASNPVLWQKTIENMIKDGFDTFIEVGAGKTLSGLIKKINADVSVYNVNNIESLEKAEEAKNA